MVIPLVPVALGASALLSAVEGLKKAWEAKQTFASAYRSTQRAQADWEAAARALEAHRMEVRDCLTSLGRKRLDVVRGSLAKFARQVDQLVESDIKDIAVGNPILPEETVPLTFVEANVYRMADILKDGLRSAATSAWVGAGVGQAAAAMGAASTGAAISGLSGAAASNATMAWLGGGSLAAGGGGMALGTAVLGGIVTGPFLFVMGHLAAGQAERVGTKAIAEVATVEVAIEQLGNAAVALSAIEARAQEVAHVLDLLDARFRAASDRVSRLVGRIRRDREAVHLDSGQIVPPDIGAGRLEYAKLSDKDRKSFDSLIALGSALYAVAKIQILDEEGSIGESSADLQTKLHSLMEEA